VKVGVTRENQIPVRWIDQGAWKAIKIAFTPYRQIAGQIEVSLKKHFTDKTPWQKMLKNEMAGVFDLQDEKNKVRDLIDPEFKKYFMEEDEMIYEFNYPVKNYPETVKSLSAEKNPIIESLLTGIRGQYLMFNEQVINLRNFSGYEIEFSY
jgi:hypothetical protein